MVFAKQAFVRFKVVARLVYQRPGDGQRRSAAQRGLSLRGRVNHQIVNDAEGLLIHGDVFVERLEVIVLWLSICEFR